MTIVELYDWAMDNDVEDMPLYINENGFIIGVDEDNLEIYENGVLVTNV